MADKSDGTVIAVQTRWHRSTLFNITVLGLANFAAPGIWSAMMSLGAGGAESPTLVNAATALTFVLMVVSCFFSPVLVHYVGIKGALVFGTLGYAPYAAGLYVNNRYGNEWMVVLGAALCGISAGVFWAAEAAIAIVYPEPWLRGRHAGLWLSYRLLGQIIAGAINVGLNYRRDTAGKVSCTVFQIFIALQCMAPVFAAFLSRPADVQRKDGRRVQLRIDKAPWSELAKGVKLLLGRKFVLVIPLIGQAVFAEAVFFTYLSLWFTVRARALGSFVSGIVAVVAGNLLGALLDRKQLPLRLRARYAYFGLFAFSGIGWTWIAVLSTRFRTEDPRPTYDWSDSGFGVAFAVFVLLAMAFQMNYLFLYFVITHLAQDEPEIVRYAALLRGVESAWQSISYGLTSLPLFAQVGGVYFNFALWALAIVPGWFVVRRFDDEDKHVPDE